MGKYLKNRSYRLGGQGFQANLNVQNLDVPLIDSNIVCVIVERITWSVSITYWKVRIHIMDCH